MPNIKLKSFKKYTGIEAAIDLVESKIYCPNNNTIIEETDDYNTLIETCTNQPTYIIPIIEVGLNIWYGHSFKEFMDMKINSIVHGKSSKPIYLGFFEKGGDNDFDPVELPILEIIIVNHLQVNIKLMTVTLPDTFDQETAQVYSSHEINGINVNYDKDVFDAAFNARGIDIKQIIAPLVTGKVYGDNLINFRAWPKRTDNGIVQFIDSRGKLKNIEYFTTDFNLDNIYLEI